MIISTYIYYGVPALQESATPAEAEGRAQAHARVDRSLDNARGATFKVPPYHGQGRPYSARNHAGRHQPKKIA